MTPIPTPTPRTTTPETHQPLQSEPNAPPPFIATAALDEVELARIPTTTAAANTSTALTTPIISYVSNPSISTTLAIIITIRPIASDNSIIAYARTYRDSLRSRRRAIPVKALSSPVSLAAVTRGAMDHVCVDPALT